MTSVAGSSFMTSMKPKQRRAEQVRGAAAGRERAAASGPVPAEAARGVVHVRVTRASAESTVCSAVAMKRTTQA
jgi:hypothetical protein